MIATSDLISQCRRVLGVSDLEIDLESAWSSETPGSRLLIRQALSHKMPSGADDRSIFDLNQIPRPEGLAVSISHCRTLGGFASSREAAKIGADLGFDVELEARIKSDVVARVSTQSELAAVPLRAYLWVAKEAAFKALFHKLPKAEKFHLSQLQIGNWSETTDGWSFFARLRNDSVKGYVTQGGALLYAFAVTLDVTNAIETDSDPG